MTPQEANVLLTCKSKAVRDFTIGALAGASLAWGGMCLLDSLVFYTHSQTRLHMYMYKFI